MEWMNAIAECLIAKINGTEVERTINEEISIAKAEVQLAELAVDIEKESSKIQDATIKQSYSNAVTRIRSKVK